MRHNGLRSSIAEHLAGIEFNEIDRLRRIGVGFGPCFPDLVNHHCTELMLSFFHELCGFEEKFSAFLRIHCLPLLECSRGRLHSAGRQR